MSSYFDYYNDIEYMKWLAQFKTQNLRLPGYAVRQLKEILEDPTITPYEFEQQLRGILNSQNALSWKVQLFVYDLPHKIMNNLHRLAWLEISIFLGLILCLYILDRRFQIKKPLKFVKDFNLAIIKRTCGVFGYYVPLLELYKTYMPFLITESPHYRVFLPDFIKVSIDYYEKISYGQIIYFFLVVYFCTEFRIPKPRSIRFHFMRGLMLATFQNITSQIFFNVYASYLKSNLVNFHQLATLALMFFILHMSWLVPSMYQALTATYPRSEFIREAVEVLLGRDNDPDFKWWDEK